MAINVTVTPRYLAKADVSGFMSRVNQLAITGLTAGAGNTIPHGLPYAPRRLNLRPGASGLWGETQLPDATNIYITVGAGGATSGTIDCEE